MELTTELKEKLSKCATAEEARAVCAEAGVALSDGALAQIAGGLQKSYDGPQYQSVTFTGPDGQTHTFR